MCIRDRLHIDFYKYLASIYDYAKKCLADIEYIKHTLNHFVNCVKEKMCIRDSVTSPVSETLMTFSSETL